MQEDKVKLIQTLLFVSGLNTLFQSFVGTRLPAVVSASYTYVPTTMSIILAARYNDFTDPQEVGEGSQQSYIFSFVLCKFGY